MLKKQIKKEKGITLVALIITIIILIILAAVSINAVYESQIIGYATNGVQNYVDTAKTENEVFENTISYVDSVLENLAQGVMQSTLEEEEVTSQTLVSQVTPEHYGNTINYSANGITDWKIFYKDETNVFIIASDYVENTKVDTEALGMSTYGSYNVGWSSFPDTSITVGRYILSGASSFTTTNNNYKATAALMNQAKWTGFVNTTYAESAIGGPTLDMWIESWNAKYPLNKLYLDTSANGYYVGTSENPTTTIINLSSSSGYNDTLYYPHKELWNECYGYWLASPFAEDAMATGNIHHAGSIQYLYPDNGGVGVRPIVCLKSTVTGTLTDTGWTLDNN